MRSASFSTESVQSRHFAYERDMPLDQDSLIQQFVYVLGSVSF